MSSADSGVPDRYRMLDPYSEEGKKRKRRARLPLVVLGSAICCIAVAVAVSFAVTNLSGPDLGAYANEQILMTGLKTEEVVVTPADLASMDCVSESFTGQGQAIGGQENVKEVMAYGPLLSDFVDANGASLGDFTRVIALCKDGYNVILTPEMLEGDIVMSIAQGNEPLEERHQPMRLVIPGEESGKWAFGVTEIVFER